GNHAAVIDVSGDTPVVIGLANPTGENEINRIDHAVVDADAGVAIGLAFVGGMDAFVVWDLENPEAEPTVYSFERGVNDALMQIEGNLLLFHDTSTNGMVEVCAFDYTTGMFTCGDEATGQVAL